MRILIGTLYSGENEIDACMRSIKNQIYHDSVYHHIISNKPNKEAHDELFKTFQKARKYYDLLIKFDADMVFTTRNALIEIVNKVKQYPNTRKFAFTIHDFYSDKVIGGVNIEVYRNNFNFETKKDDIFVDALKTNTESETINFKPGKKMAIHNPNPTDNHSYKFGIHKAIKVLQRDRKTIKAGRAIFHLRNILFTYEAYKNKNNEKRKEALIGAIETFKGNYNVFHYLHPECIVPKDYKIRKKHILYIFYKTGINFLLRAKYREVIKVITGK